MARLPAVIDLSTLNGGNGFRLDGIEAYDYSGISVASAGDVNGDGFDDLIIGAFGADAGGYSYAGSSYVVFGSAAGLGAVFDLSALDGTNGFRLDGINMADESGLSVASAGDVNGDGFDDLIVGAYDADPGGDNFAGESYVVFGKTFGFGASLDLAALDGTNGFRLDGIDAYDQSGFSVASAGDVNGDGLDDIIIGAFGADPGGVPQAGESYVVFGKTSGFDASLDLASLDGTNGFRIDGVDSGDTSGTSVASAGDVNGDGLDDIIIGSWRADPNSDNYAGSSFVVFGTDAGFGPAVDLSALDGTNGFRLDGINANDNSGHSVASAGDINGDGFDDIIVGAYGADPKGLDEGQSYVVFGKASGFDASLDLAALDGTNGFRIDGDDAIGQSGFSVASAGDVNGDGLDDLIVGANFASPNGTYTGASYVVFGSRTGFGASIDLASLDGTNGLRLDGVNADDGSGSSVASGGDVNGDGFDDLIIGAPGADPNGDAYAGSSYVVFGSGAGDFPAVLSLDGLAPASGTVIMGLADYDNSGISVASAGDVNGDGFGDVIIGAYAADPGGDSYAGSSYVVFGTAGGRGANVDLAALDGSNGFRIDGAAGGDYSGISVASAGDVDGDGFDDLIIGASGADPGGDPYAGSSFVVFGSDAGFAASIDLASVNGSNGFRLDGLSTYDFSGWSVASAGDVNGDGFGDIIIGAYNVDAGSDYDYNSGASYVVFGSDAGFAASIDLGALDGTDGFRIDGIEANDYSGRSVASAGDFNGDGFDDLIIGAHRADVGADSGAGASYVVFGSDASFAATVDLASLDGSNGFRLDGINASDNAGVSVASAGDVNGDGLDDIIVGAYHNDPAGRNDAGESYVVFGNTSDVVESIDLSTLDGTTGFRIDGGSQFDQSGFSVASAGDVNGDGFDDLLIGAFRADPGGDNSAGESFVVFGKASGFGTSIDLAALDGSDGFRIDGIDPNDYAGYSVASAGDVNGDGFDDLIVGAHGADPGGYGKAGESYIIYGRAPTAAVTRIGSAADQSIHGGAFDDMLRGVRGDDTLHGGAGLDQLFGGAGADGLLGGEGDDSLFGHGGNDMLDGGSGADVLRGGLGADVMRGGDGDDLYVVDDSDDQAVENDGEGTDGVLTRVSFGLDSGVENLTLRGTDAIDGTGNGLDNLLRGNDAANRLDGGGGADMMIGRLGDDIYVVDDAGDQVVEWSGDGEDAVESSIEYRLGHDVEDLTLTGLDAIRGTGNGLDNGIVGNAAANLLMGNAGADVLDGGDGGDTLIGGVGTDQLTGGAGADRFHFNDGESAADAGAADHILDFTTGEDRINFSRIDADSSTGADDRFSFIGTDAFTGTAGELRYEVIGGDAFVQADADGDGTADFAVWVDNVTSLGGGDFFL